MRKLNGYIARSVLGAVAMVLLVIVALDAISALVDELGSIKGNYTIAEVFVYVGLTLPGRIYENIPFSALVGCLIGLGSLAGSSELVVMRAAGVSLLRITWAVMKPVLWFIVLGLVIGEYLTPFSDQIAESRRSLAQGDTRALESRRGLWNREGNEYMHFNAVEPNGRLHGVTRYLFDDAGRMQSSSFSATAIYQGDYWQEENVVLTRFEDNQSHLQTIERRRWETALSPRLLNILVLDPAALSIRSLHSYAGYLDGQGVDSKEYWLAFWQKVLQPVATASLVLIAISFIFGPLREVTMGQRIFSGVVVGIVFRTVQGLLGPSSIVFGFPPLMAVAAPVLVCGLLGVLLLRRAR